jgi:hypothetical protein
VGPAPPIIASVVAATLMQPFAAAAEQSLFQCTNAFRAKEGVG